MARETVGSEVKIKSHERKIRLLDAVKWTMWGIYNLALVALLTQPGVAQGIGAGMLAGEVGVIVGRKLF